MTEEAQKELQSLLMELTEGELSSEQRQRLAEMMRQHPAAKQQYLETCQMHTMLAWEHGVLGDLKPELSETPPPPSNSFSFWKPLAMAAGVLVVTPRITIRRIIKNGTRRIGRFSDPERGRQP